MLDAGDSEAMRRLVREDLFFLLTIACKRKDIDRDWLYARCREVEADPNWRLDLWAREHYKSTIITFGKTIQDILINPNITVGIFSHTRPIAKGFLKQIMREFEGNNFLKNLFPDVLYQNPKTEAPVWSLDGGIVVKRSTNPKENTVEAWGLVDGQPTSKHFSLLVYDDVVTRESVTTPEQIAKVTDAWALSLNLGADGGHERYIGTRYHQNDTYKTMISRGSVRPRTHTATSNGRDTGEPVFLSKEALVKKRRDMGPYIFSAQMLQDPAADKAMGFKPEWLKFYKKADADDFNIYLLADPANARKKTSDYTVFMVVGLAPDNNYYLLDAIRDRLNLTGRTEKFFELHRKWRPLMTGYEQYGMQSDIEHIRYVMEEKNYRFNISELGGSAAKVDRIGKLVPLFEQGRMYLPEQLSFVSAEGKSVDFVQTFVDEEYNSFPVSSHDDMLDCLARILDPQLAAAFPEEEKPKERSEGGYRGSTGWMA